MTDIQITDKDVYIATIADVKKTVSDLANKKMYIYRGHSEPVYLLESTLVRFLQKDNDIYYHDAIMSLISRYVSGCLRIGEDTTSHSLREIIEMARHDGLPSSLIDFSYSPYVALFFAFQLTEEQMDASKGDDEYVVLNRLNYHLLGKIWAEKMFLKYPSDSIDYYSAFLNAESVFMSNDIPIEYIGFLKYPSRFNNRMLSQKGCFIYDGLLNVHRQHQSMHRFSDYMTLDKFIEENELLAEAWRPQYSEGFRGQRPHMVRDRCLKKYFIRKKLFREVLVWLKGMGITMESLFMSREAVVKDAIQYTSWARSADRSMLVSEAAQLCSCIKFNMVPLSLIKTTQAW